jgi:uncharacterized membrane protein
VILTKIPFSLEDSRGDLAYNKKFCEYLLHGHQEEAHKLMVTHFNTLTAIMERCKKKEGKK